MEGSRGRVFSVFHERGMVRRVEQTDPAENFRTDSRDMGGEPEMNDFDGSFELQWHGNTVIITPTSDIEHLKWDLIEPAAAIVMSPLEDVSVPMVVFDLSNVKYFGSVFLALLLRCHKLVRSRGGELGLCGVSPLAKELLKITALDTLWAIYDSKEEALEALKD